MQITFIVKVTVRPIEPQSLKEFNAEDGNDMIPYLSEKIHDSLDESFANNAKVTSAKITHPKK